MGEAYEVRIVWNIEKAPARTWRAAQPLVDPNDALAPAPQPSLMNVPENRSRALLSVSDKTGLADFAKR